VRVFSNLYIGVFRREDRCGIRKTRVTVMTTILEGSLHP
jgi:hypothetical protein